MSTPTPLGSFYLGKFVNASNGKLEDKELYYDSKDLTTHAVCVGMTGSGKTGLGIGIIEEAGLNGIPALIVDPKGDLGNLMLMFPELQPNDFKPWADEADASRKGMTLDQYAENIAKNWKEGLEKWGESPERIKAYKEKVDAKIYTPASKAGIPISILNSFSAPSDELLLDEGALRDRVLSTTSSLLGLLGINADPIKSRESILISTIIDQAWRKKQNLDIASLIQSIQKPPFEKVGVFDTESFYPQKDRMNLAMSLNNLLASPSFQAWMTGEPLDIQRLLYSPSGKPQHAILTIAHLSDSERMFFVTLLLNEVISWMRRQSGTTNLRAILYMDEIFGYFPPTAVPPSKMPMLTLLKQARAFGLGVVLCTQNPSDLDYKGLANCGTWLIGKLQTDRDRSRVLEGLRTSSNGELDSPQLEKMIAACGSRVFILQSVHRSEPSLFQTRWTLSYLRGPLTLPQIQKLMSVFKSTQVNQEGVVAQPATSQQAAAASTTKQIAPSGIKEFYIQPKSTLVPLTYEAKVVGIAKLHFVDSKNKIDVWQDFVTVAPLDDQNVKWSGGEDITEVRNYLQTEVPSNSAFKEMPPALMQAKNFANFSKAYAEYLYQNQVLTLFQDEKTKLISKLGENEQDFKSRVASAFGGKVDGSSSKIRERYDSKIQTLQDKIKRAQDKITTAQSQAGRKKMDTFISVGTTLLGTLFGKGVSKGTISQAGTSIKNYGKISKDEQTIGQVQETLTSLQEQLQDLEAQRDRELSALTSGTDVTQVALDKVIIRPRKGDISVETIGIVWVPVLKN